MKSINQEISHLDPKENIKILTILEGEGLGTKAIYKDNTLFQTDGNRDYFAGLENSIKDIQKSRKFELEDRTLILEVLNPDINVIIFGAGHVSLPVIKLLKEMEMHVTVYDDREGFDEWAYGAGADKVVIGNYDELTKNIESDENTYFIIVTQGHSSDEVCLENIIEKPFGYIGMIGSRHRIRHYHERFLEKGFTEEQWEKIHTPIGLPIKANTPFEIAVSILAEIIQVKNTKVTEKGYISKIVEIMQENPEGEYVMATVVERRGSAPRDLGAKMLVAANGDFYGTVGGGKMERRVLDEAKEVMKTGSPLFHYHDMTNVEAWETSSVCGGKMRVFIEKM